jgi:hypothetical protein
MILTAAYTVDDDVPSNMFELMTPAICVSVPITPRSADTIDNFVTAALALGG